MSESRAEAEQQYANLLSQVVGVERHGATEQGWTVDGFSLDGKNVMVSRRRSYAEISAQGGLPLLVDSVPITELLALNPHLVQPAKKLEVQADQFADIRNGAGIAKNVEMVRGQTVFPSECEVQVRSSDGKNVLTAIACACVLDKKGCVKSVVIGYDDDDGSVLKAIPVEELVSDNPKMNALITAFEQRNRQPGQASTNLVSRLRGLLRV